MLQVTTDSATMMCGTAFCRAALQNLYSALLNCRYYLGGQYSSKQLLEYCAISLTNMANLHTGSETIVWNVVLDSVSLMMEGRDG